VGCYPCGDHCDAVFKTRKQRTTHYNQIKVVEENENFWLKLNGVKEAGEE